MLVGFSGKKRSGKGTAADYLVREHGFTKVGFKDAVYELLYEINPIVLATNNMTRRIQDVVNWNGWEYSKDHYPEVRPLQKRLGLGARDVFGADFWVQIVAKKIGPLTRVVIDDVRFQNEARFVEDSGGVLIRLNSPRDDWSDPHESEISLDAWPFDNIIANDGTPEELWEKVRCLVFG
jgi:hypothetical protein